MKPTVGFCKSQGVEFVKGDVYHDGETTHEFNPCNKECQIDFIEFEDMTIVSFAWRDFPTRTNNKFDFELSVNCKNWRPSIGYLADKEKQMSIDNIAVTQQEEEFNAMSKVEPKEGEWWMCGGYHCGVAPLKKSSKGWCESDDSSPFCDAVITPISRLYTQEEYDNKPVDDSEWNGEGLPPIGSEVMCYLYDYQANRHWRKRIVLGYGKHSDDHVDNSIIVDSGEVQFRFTACVEYKAVESPEDKEARERLESAYDLYLTAVDAGCGDEKKIGIQQFKSNHILVGAYSAIVDKTGYRK